jgi:hypothetical protein
MRFLLGQDAANLAWGRVVLNLIPYLINLADQSSYIFNEILSITIENVSYDLLSRLIGRSEEQVIDYCVIAVTHRQRVRNILEPGDLG